MQSAKFHLIPELATTLAVSTNTVQAGKTPTAGGHMVICIKYPNNVLSLFQQ